MINVLRAEAALAANVEVPDWSLGVDRARARNDSEGMTTILKGRTDHTRVLSEDQIVIRRDQGARVHVHGGEGTIAAGINLPAIVVGARNVVSYAENTFLLEK